MKKLLIFLGLVVFLQTKAQSTLDQQLVNINQSTVTSGIIYERVNTFSNLYTYNQPNGTNNTADYQYFEQALSELHRASNKLKLISHYELRNRIVADENTKNMVNIGIINTQYSVLNYNFENPALGGLTFANDLFSQVAGKVPFYDMHALVIAPLKNVAQGSTITYRFKTNLLLTNGTRTIKKLVANLGDGVLRTVINNGVIVIPSVNITNSGANGFINLVFNVTFNNNLTMTTNGKIYLFKPISSAAVAPLAASTSGNIVTNPQSTPCGFDDITEDMLETDPVKLAISGNSKRLVSDYSYQGLNETVAIQGEIEVRIYYRKKNGTEPNLQRTLLKPIIIIDGFDPKDTRKFEDCDCQNDADCAEKYTVGNIFKVDNHRSLVDLMGYKDTSITPNISKNLITTLRDTGFDVIIVNQPNYVRNGVKIDGGSDFIERNAMNLASLLKKLNQTLLANNSNNKIVIVGPSMGGQISRYALAWMEKKFAETGLAQYNHNTRLWVAFDSPNLGSNVPLGDQALINLLGEDSTNAETKYKEYLGSTASKELLIEYHQQATITVPIFGTIPNVSAVINANLSGETTTMGMSGNKGNPYFQYHYNNQFNNGLTNSKGYPMNLRKIAIVNGSLSGVTTGTGSEKILDIKAIQRVCYQPFNLFGWSPSVCNTIKLSDIEAYNMPNSGGYGKVAYFDKIIGSGKHTNASNLNIRGNMDTVPGGTYGATGDIATGITSVPVFGTRGSFWQYPGDNLLYFFSNSVADGAYWDVRTLKPIHSFIPTFSALGMKNPNQSWANPLNRNLVCSNETPFDSYFGEAENTEHTLLNYKSVDWFLKELETSPLNPQAPFFPLDQNALSGNGIICKNENATFVFADICKIPSLVTSWNVTSNANIISSNSNTLVIKGNTDGPVTLTANFTNGQTFTKDIRVLTKPFFSVRQYTHVGTEGYYLQLIAPVGRPFSEQLIGNITWENLNTGGTGSLQYTPGNSYTNFLLCAPATEYDNYPAYTFCKRDIKVTLSNYCGSTEYIASVGYGQNPEAKTANNTLSNSFYKIYPNPTNNIVNVELKSQDIKPLQNANIIAELYNMMGEVKRNVSITNNIANIDVSGLPQGIYLLKINIDGVIESHQVGVE